MKVSFLQQLFKARADKEELALRRTVILRAAPWYAFIFFCIFGMFCFGNTGALAACLVLAFYFGLLIAAAKTTSKFIPSLQSYEAAHGTLAGFKTIDTLSYDLEKTYHTDLTPEEAFQQIAHVLSAGTRTKFLHCDSGAHEIIALATLSSVRYLFSDATRTFIKIYSDDAGKTVVAARTVASLFAQNSECFALQNIIAAALTRHDELKPVQTPQITKEHTPLWAGCCINALALFVTTSALGIAIHNANQDSYSQITNMLEASQYSLAVQSLARYDANQTNETVDSFTSNERYCALLGAKKYSEAIDQLDSKTDPELIAFAQASENEFDEASRTLASINPATDDLDVEALYLTKAMIASARGERSDAMAALTVARAAINATLGNLATAEEARLLHSLGKHKDAQKIEAELKQKITSAEGYLRYDPFLFPVCAALLFSLSIISSCFTNRLLHKSQAGFPQTAEWTCNVTTALGPSAAFDHCLLVLSQQQCAVTNMDDEHGTIDTVDSTGTPLTLKLKQSLDGTKILIKPTSGRETTSSSALRLKEMLES